MSFLDDIIDFGSSVVNFVGGNTLGGSLARTAITGFALNQITKSINKDNATNADSKTAVDYGVREQVDPNTDNTIPVVYGTAFVGGRVTDAVLTNSNQTMWYCLTICEKTGALINGTASQITIQRIFWNQNEIIFKSDGVTVDKFISSDGTEDTSPSNLIKIYLYNGGSVQQTWPAGFAGSTTPAYSIFPNWTTNHLMSDLVFALVRVDYNKTNNVTGIGNIEFKVSNTMSEAGDCLYDYMTNTRYGAGIAPEEINA